jgi:dienelactone hydrolase
MVSRPVWVPAARRVARDVEEILGGERQPDERPARRSRDSDRGARDERAGHWEKVRRLHPALPVHVYPAGHGFSCDARGSYHEPSAQLARERSLAFFRQHIG